MEIVWKRTLDELPTPYVKLLCCDITMSYGEVDYIEYDTCSYDPANGFSYDKNTEVWVTTPPYYWAEIPQPETSSGDYHNCGKNWWRHLKLIVKEDQT